MNSKNWFTVKKLPMEFHLFNLKLIMQAHHSPFPLSLIYIMFWQLLMYCKGKYKKNITVQPSARKKELDLKTN